MPRGREESAAPSAEGSQSLRTALAVATLVVAAVLLVTGLGHHALWDDEAMTALNARAILRTGDTSALHGHNVFAYRNGALLHEMHDRFTAPLQSYLSAVSLALIPNETIAARLPFALCGWITVVLIFAFARRARATTSMWVLIAIALLCSVSFFLHCRQGRYYALAILFSVAIAYAYLYRRPGWRGIALLAGLSVALLASNILNFFALYACLAVDYLLWERHAKPLGRREWLGLIVPQLFIGGAILSVWNPLMTDHDTVYTNALWRRVLLFWWNIRDMNRCEFGPALLLVAAPALFLLRRDRWLLRIPAALVVYAATVALISPQVVRGGGSADVRYLAPTIPLWIGLGALVVNVVTQGRLWPGLVLALVAFGTNLLHGTGLTRPRVTPAHFARELIDPPSDPYREAVFWIQANLPAGASIWVLPHYMTYPLMFHAPDFVYAWQLDSPPAAQFRELPAIHFKDQVSPDYIICFGPLVSEVRRRIAAWQPNPNYVDLATLDHFWREMIRPELSLHSFEPIRGFDRALEAIYVFENQSPAVSSGR